MFDVIHIAGGFSGDPVVRAGVRVGGALGEVGVQPFLNQTDRPSTAQAVRRPRPPLIDESQEQKRDGDPKNPEGARSGARWPRARFIRGGGWSHGSEPVVPQQDGP